MSVGSRIKEARKKINLTQEELADLIGVTKGAVANYENEVSTPKIEILYKLFGALKCDANYLYQDDMMQNVDVKDERYSVSETEIIKKYRVLNDRRKKIIDDTLDELYSYTISQPKKDKLVKYIDICKYDIAAGAGIGSYLQDQEYTLIRVPGNAVTTQADYAVGVSGKSMEPDFQDGDTVLVKSMPCINVGETGIFVVNGDAYIKKLGDGRLISTNKDYNDIVLSEYDTVTCLGKVVGKI